MGWGSEWNTKKLTLPETNISSLKIGHPNRKVVFQPSIFRGYASFGEGSSTWNFGWCWCLNHFLVNGGLGLDYFTPLWHSLKLTARHRKYGEQQKERIVFQPSISRWYILLSGSVHISLPSLVGHLNTRTLKSHHDLRGPNGGSNDPGFHKT